MATRNTWVVPGMGGIELELMTIGPELAEKFLQTVITNRRHKDAHIDTMAADMPDRWHETALDPLRFDEDGHLIDGENRLRALIKSGATLRFLVARGVPRATQLALDRGKPRTLADELRLRHEKYTKDLAGGIKFVYRYDAGELLNTSFRRSDQTMLRWFAEHEVIRDSAAIASRTYSKDFTLSKTAMTGVHFAAWRLHGADATAFFEQLRSGANHPEGSPVLWLRGWATRTAGTKGTKPHPLMAHALLIKGFNAWLLGRSVQFLRWNPGGRQREPFPVIVADATGDPGA